jgi:hypothetical protein
MWEKIIEALNTCKTAIRKGKQDTRTFFIEKTITKTK